MTLNRRRLLGLVGAAGAVSSAPAVRPPGSTPAAGAAGDDEPHARFMRYAIEAAYGNELYPFGAVFVASGRVLGRGVNASVENPTYHGEMVAMADYVRRVGNHGWATATLYSTAEPCAMCMGACAWAGVGRIIWGTSLEGLRRTGLVQITIPAREVADAARSFYAPRLLGGVMAGTTDALFRRARTLRERRAGGSR
ncbi:deaminase [Streptomyces sp. NPDC048277]|uniref:nucleoside deaminase n=1 Tax=Streptomyces sp. NPDC048277 TaxID=3155027 RepID=UPI00340CF836